MIIIKTRIIYKENNVPISFSRNEGIKYTNKVDCLNWTWYASQNLFYELNSITAIKKVIAFLIDKIKNIAKKKLILCLKCIFANVLKNKESWNFSISKYNILIL